MGDVEPAWRLFTDHVVGSRDEGRVMLEKGLGAGECDGPVV